MSDTEEKYVIRTQGKKVYYQDGSVAAREGEWFWVLKEPEGWVPATSAYSQGPDKVNSGALAFDTKDEAEAFIKGWKGHPWWCQPNGVYQIFKVTPVFKQIRVGWQKEA